MLVTKREKHSRAKNAKYSSPKIRSMVRTASDMSILKRRGRNLLYFCSVFLIVRTGFKALHNVRSKLMHRRAIMDGYVMEEYGYPPYQANFDLSNNQGEYSEYQDFHQDNNPRLAYQQYQQVQVAPVAPVQPVALVQPVAPVVQVVQVPSSSTEAPKVVPQAEKLTFEEPQGLLPLPRSIPLVEEGDDEVVTVSKWDWNYSDEVDQGLLNYNYEQMIPNANFIYHNKLPKSGSTTMHDILRELSQKNLFYYKKMDSSNMGFDDDISLTDYIKENIKRPFFFHQHHFYTNFTKFDIDQPTMINVIREPISWFSSHYHFKLYGWSRKPGQRGDQNEMTLQECIDSGAPTCARNHWRYMEFFCGSGPECQTATNQADEEAYKTRMLEKAKQRVLNDYFVIGVLEQFEDSLRVFEKLLPRYYRGALDVYHSKNIQTTRNQTKSLNKQELPDASIEKLRNGALRHEVDLYRFTRQLFNERMKKMQMQRWGEMDEDAEL